MLSRPFSLASAIAVATLLLAAASAQAGTLAVEDGTAVLTAAPGERNDVRMQPTPATGAPALTVSDVGAPLVAGAGCVQVDANTVRCDEASRGALPLLVSTADGNDRVALAENCCRTLTVRGGAGNDALRVDSQNGTPVDLDGGAGDDVLVSNEQLGGVPVLRGGYGDDSLRISGGSTVGGEAYGGPGDDKLDWSNGTRISSFPLVLDGGTGEDTYSFGLLFVPEAMVPGAGFDTLDQSDAPAPLTFALASCGSCVERVIGTAQADTITGDGRAQAILGGGGDDQLDGGGGPDAILGQEGNDTIMARDGTIDAVHCGQGSDAVTADRRDLVSPTCERVTRSR